VGCGPRTSQLDFGGNLDPLFFHSIMHFQLDGMAIVHYCLPGASTIMPTVQRNNIEISFLIFYYYSPGGSTSFDEAVRLPSALSLFKCVL